MVIYLAAPLFSVMERDGIDNLVFDICRELNLDPVDDFYIPYRDCEYLGSEESIYDTNIQNLNMCDIMIAVLDGQDVDSGTAFEIGYFSLQEKPVIGILTDTRSYNEYGEFNSKLNTMIFGSLDYGGMIVSDFNVLVDKLESILMEW